MSSRSLRILVLGSLGPNQDRILALSRLGHHLAYGYTEFHPNIIPLETEIDCFAIPRRNAVPALARVAAEHEIQVIYSLLNAHDGSTEITIEILESSIDIPIVRHYKEHPCTPTFEERQVLLETAAQIYINDESYTFFRDVYGCNASTAHIMDADMIAERYMGDQVTSKLSQRDGAPHLLVAGGLSAQNDRLDVRELCIEMNRRHVHVHLYGYMVGRNADSSPIFNDSGTRQIYERMAEDYQYVHLHGYIKPSSFSSVWSQYDAGFMHARVAPGSKEARFEQMNLPYRYTAYLAAGLPLVVFGKGQDAMERVVRQNGIGLVFSDYDDLAERLRDVKTLGDLSTSVMDCKRLYTFESKAEDLVSILAVYAN